MKQKITFLSLAFLLSFSFHVDAQTNKELALQKARQGIVLEDKEGKYDEAIKLFEEAQKLDPESITYPYEISYAYIAKKEYKKASEILERLLSHKDVDGQIYQSLGNTYDNQENPKKAIETYEKGLTKFPNFGGLYLELGNMMLGSEKYESALSYYEKGIERDPKFASNYYWASIIYCSSTEEVWGMIYGELFMNLERNSKRTAEISKILFDTYKKEIQFSGDTSFSVSFSKINTIDANSIKKGKKMVLPFGMGCYEFNLMQAILGDTKIDLNSLDRIRTRFLDFYFKSPNSVNYPNALFDYQKKVQLAGHLEAYNHWILMKGDEDSFDKWLASNKGKWSKFMDWFAQNSIELNKGNRFYRAQYL